MELDGNNEDGPPVLPGSTYSVILSYLWESPILFWWSAHYCTSRPACKLEN